MSTNRKATAANRLVMTFPLGGAISFHFWSDFTALKIYYYAWTTYWLMISSGPKKQIMIQEESGYALQKLSYYRPLAQKKRH
jgi:hypothetical protein